MNITPTIRGFLLGTSFSGGSKEYALARMDEIDEDRAQSDQAGEFDYSDLQSAIDNLLERNQKLGSKYRRKYTDDQFRSGEVLDYTAPNHGIIYDLFETCDLEQVKFFDRLMNRENLRLLRIVFTHAKNLGITPDAITNDHVEAYRLITYRYHEDVYMPRYDTEIAGMERSASDSVIARVLTDDGFAGHVLRVAPSYIEDREGFDARDLVRHLMETQVIETPFVNGHL